MLLELYVQAQAWFEGLKDRFESDEGATAVEYGLIVALIAAIIVGVVGLLGGQVKTGFQTVCDALKTSAC
jgi:pilus assembly protein Flp/PilA